MKIKVCGMKHKQNIKELIALNPDYIGFIFYEKSPRFIGHTIHREIIQLFPVHIKKTGVFVNALQDEVVENARRNELDIIQLHGYESPGYCEAVRAKNYPVMKVFGVGSRDDMQNIKPYEEVCDYFLFDTKSKAYGGTGTKFDWNIICEYEHTVPFFLSGGIGPGDAEIINELRCNKLFAVDINSKFETYPGMKNISSINTFIKQLNINK